MKANFDKEIDSKNNELKQLAEKIAQLTKDKKELQEIHEACKKIQVPDKKEKFDEKNNSESNGKDIFDPRQRHFPFVSQSLNQQNDSLPSLRLASQDSKKIISKHEVYDELETPSYEEAFLSIEKPLQQVVNHK